MRRLLRLMRIKRARAAAGGSQDDNFLRAVQIAQAREKELEPVGVGGAQLEEDLVTGVGVTGGRGLDVDAGQLQAATPGDGECGFEGVERVGRGHGKTKGEVSVSHTETIRKTGKNRLSKYRYFWQYLKGNSSIS